jgi:adenylate cyclase
MNWSKNLISKIVDSGISENTSSLDARYIRFLNTTLLIFGLSQLPIIMLLLSIRLEVQLVVNSLALGLCGIGYLLNQNGYHQIAKIGFMSVVLCNSTYFAFVLGSSAPTHLWLVPISVLGVLVFKPTEWRTATVFVGLSIVIFTYFEFMYLDIEPLVLPFANAQDKLQAAHFSTASAIVFTLVLVGMMHRRFAQSEVALSQEKEQSERLLRAILPEEIAEELRQTGMTKAVRHEDVSLLFADIVGFTPLAASMPAEDVVAMLAKIFEQFDALIMDCGVEKIKTIGDAYMIAAGVPKAVIDHPERMIKCAVGMMRIMEDFSSKSTHRLQLRIGLHRGPVVAGVIGTTKFAYDLWGESVNLASRLESSGQPGQIHVSDHFRTRLDKNYDFEERGEIELKGVGRTRTHWLIC